MTTDKIMINNTHCPDAYQLRMYRDGRVMDNIHVDEGFLKFSL